MIPSADFIDWLLEAARWEVEHLSMTVSIEDGASIVLPTETDFPIDPSLEGHDLAQDYLAFVLEHSRLSDWPYEIVPDDPRSPAAIVAGMPHHMTEAPVPIEEDEEIEEGEPLVIPYEPALVAKPDLLVAQLARGVAHYYAYSATAPAPGGEESIEFAIDVTATFLGFGVFTANAAFVGEAVDTGALSGFRWRRLGALGSLELAYTLGLRAELIGADIDEIREHLKPNPRAWVADAVRDLRRHRAAELDAIRMLPRRSTGIYR
jgi:hypothetical protein